MSSLIRSVKSVSSALVGRETQIAKKQSEKAKNDERMSHLVIGREPNIVDDVAAFSESLRKE